MSVGYCLIPGMSQPRLSMTDDEKKQGVAQVQDLCAGTQCR